MATSLRVLTLENGTFRIRSITHLEGILKEHDLLLYSDEWYIREATLRVRLGPYQYGVRACHPMFPDVYAIFDLNDLAQLQSVLKICDREFDPSFIRRGN